MARDQRKEILNAALKCCEQGHILSVTRDAIATQANVPASLISYYFGTMAGARQATVVHAIDTRNLKVMSQALTLPGDYLDGAVWVRLKSKAREITGA